MDCDFPPVPWTTTTTVNVRTLPTVDSPRLGAIGPGITVGQIGPAEGAWIPVRFEGWMHASYLQAPQTRVSTPAKAGKGSAESPDAAASSASRKHSDSASTP